MIAILLAMLFCPPNCPVAQPMTELICDRYEYGGPDTIVCHGNGLDDVTLDHAFMGFDVSPDDGEVYLFVAGYPRAKEVTTEL